MDNDKPLSYTFFEVYKMYLNNVKNETDKMDINPTFRFIFMVLRKAKKGLSQNQICEFTHLKKPTVSLTLNQMEEEGYIIKEKNKDDNRLSIIKLTKKGQELDNKIKAIFDKYDQIMQLSLSSEELKQLKNYLDRIIFNLKGENQNV